MPATSSPSSWASANRGAPSGGTVLERPAEQAAVERHRGVDVRALGVDEAADAGADMSLGGSWTASYGVIAVRNGPQLNRSGSSGISMPESRPRSTPAREHPRAEPLAHLVHRLVERERPHAVDRQARAARRRRPRGWSATARPACTRAPRMVGMRRRHQLARGAQQHARLRRRLRDRQRPRRAREVVEAQPQDHRPRHAPRRPQPPRDPVDQRRPAPRRATRGVFGCPRRPIARCPPIDRRRRPTVDRAADRDCARARAVGARTRARACPTSASSESAATSPTVLIPRACSLSAVLTPTPHSFSTGSGCRNSSSPRRLHQQQPVRLRHAARRPSPGTSSARRRP